MSALRSVRRKSKQGVLSASVNTDGSLAHKHASFCAYTLIEKAGEMIPYMNLNEQVDADFTRARRRARLRAVVARIRRKYASNRLLSFDDVRRELAANNRLQRGTRDVGADEIVGSVGREIGRGTS